MAKLLFPVSDNMALRMDCRLFDEMRSDKAKWAAIRLRQALDDGICTFSEHMAARWALGVLTSILPKDADVRFYLVRGVERLGLKEPPELTAATDFAREDMAHIRDRFAGVAAKFPDGRELLVWLGRDAQVPQGEPSDLTKSVLHLHVRGLVTYSGLLYDYRASDKGWPADCDKLAESVPLALASSVGLPAAPAPAAPSLAAPSLAVPAPAAAAPAIAKPRMSSWVMRLVHARTDENIRDWMDCINWSATEADESYLSVGAALHDLQDLKLCTPSENLAARWALGVLSSIVPQYRGVKRIGILSTDGVFHPVQNLTRPQLKALCASPQAAGAASYLPEAGLAILRHDGSLYAGVRAEFADGCTLDVRLKHVAGDPNDLAKSAVDCRILGLIDEAFCLYHPRDPTEFWPKQGAVIARRLEAALAESPPATPAPAASPEPAKMEEKPSCEEELPEKKWCEDLPEVFLVGFAAQVMEAFAIQSKTASKTAQRLARLLLWATDDALAELSQVPKLKDSCRLGLVYWTDGGLTARLWLAEQVISELAVTPKMELHFKGRHPFVGLPPLSQEALKSLRAGCSESVRGFTRDWVGSELRRRVEEEAAAAAAAEKAKQEAEAKAKKEAAEAAKAAVAAKAAAPSKLAQVLAPLEMVKWKAPFSVCRMIVEHMASIEPGPRAALIRGVLNALAVMLPANTPGDRVGIRIQNRLTDRGDYIAQLHATPVPGRPSIDLAGVEARGVGTSNERLVIEWRDPDHSRLDAIAFQVSGPDSVENYRERGLKRLEASREKLHKYIEKYIQPSIKDTSMPAPTPAPTAVSAPEQRKETTEDRLLRLVQVVAVEVRNQYTWGQAVQKNVTWFNSLWDKTLATIAAVLLPGLDEDKGKITFKFSGAGLHQMQVKWEGPGGERILACVYAIYRPDQPDQIAAIRLSRLDDRDHELVTLGQRSDDEFVAALTRSLKRLREQQVVNFVRLGLAPQTPPQAATVNLIETLRLHLSPAEVEALPPALRDLYRRTQADNTRPTEGSVAILRDLKLMALTQLARAWPYLPKDVDPTCRGLSKTEFDGTQDLDNYGQDTRVEVQHASHVESRVLAGLRLHALPPGSHFKDALRDALLVGVRFTTAGDVSGAALDPTRWPADAPPLYIELEFPYIRSTVVDGVYSTVAHTKSSYSLTGPGASYPQIAERLAARAAACGLRVPAAPEPAPKSNEAPSMPPAPAAAPAPTPAISALEKFKLHLTQNSIDALPDGVKTLFASATKGFDSPIQDHYHGGVQGAMFAALATICRVLMTSNIWREAPNFCLSEYGSNRQLCDGELRGSLNSRSDYGDMHYIGLRLHRGSKPSADNVLMGVRLHIGAAIVTRLSNQSNPWKEPLDSVGALIEFPAVGDHGCRTLTSKYAPEIGMPDSDTRATADLLEKVYAEYGLMENAEAKSRTEAGGSSPKPEMELYDCQDCGVGVERPADKTKEPVRCSKCETRLGGSREAVMSACEKCSFDSEGEFIECEQHAEARAEMEAKHKANAERAAADKSLILQAQISGNPVKLSGGEWYMPASNSIVRIGDISMDEAKPSKAAPKQAGRAEQHLAKLNDTKRNDGQPPDEATRHAIYAATALAFDIRGGPPVPLDTAPAPEPSFIAELEGEVAEAGRREAARRTLQQVAAVASARAPVAAQELLRADVGQALLGLVLGSVLQQNEVADLLSAVGVDRATAASAGRQLRREGVKLGAGQLVDLLALAVSGMREPAPAPAPLVEASAALPSAREPSIPARSVLEAAPVTFAAPAPALAPLEVAHGGE